MHSNEHFKASVSTASSAALLSSPSTTLLAKAQRSAKSVYASLHIRHALTCTNGRRACRNTFISPSDNTNLLRIARVLLFGVRPELMIRLRVERFLNLTPVKRTHFCDKNTTKSTFVVRVVAFLRSPSVVFRFR